MSSNIGKVWLYSNCQLFKILGNAVLVHPIDRECRLQFEVQRVDHTLKICIGFFPKFIVWYIAL